MVPLYVPPDRTSTPTPLLTTLLKTAPEPTSNVAPARRLGRPVVPLVSSKMPPEDTIAVPPVRIVAPMSVPPDNTISVPPLDTVVLFAVPPDSTTCEPVKTVAPLAEP